MINGIGSNLSNLFLVTNDESRSISPENFHGERGEGGKAEHGNGEYPARELGKGWKVSPSVNIGPKQLYTMAEIDGPAMLQHIWLTYDGTPGRMVTIRIYWDGQEKPSVECPLSDFFASAYNPDHRTVSSLAVCVNPKNGMNCYWQMPFRSHCKITLENIGDTNVCVWYQIDYTLTEIPENSAYFHAQFRRSNPLPYMQDHTILDGVTGQGHYVGTYIAWGVNNNGWWGEGEIKMFIDGDKDYPTICGTGTEDYFCGAHNFDVKNYNADYCGSLYFDTKGRYEAFSSPYSGFFPFEPDGLYRSQQRFSMYRWHITDPIRFKKDIRITIQALGWRSGTRYLPLQDDISSVAFWYQTLPTPEFPQYPSKDQLEII